MRVRGLRQWVNSLGPLLLAILEKEVETACVLREEEEEQTLQSNEF